MTNFDNYQYAKPKQITHFDSKKSVKTETNSEHQILTVADIQRTDKF